MELFVGVLGASNFVYAEACPAQDLASWIGAHVRMLEAFVGCPAVVVPDNLRSGVTQACRYQPMINRTDLDYVAVALMLRSHDQHGASMSTSHGLNPAPSSARALIVRTAGLAAGRSGWPGRTSIVRYQRVA